MTRFLVVENAINRGSGTGDLFLTDAGLFFVLYGPGSPTAALSNQSRPHDWAVKLDDRVKNHPGSFFIEKSRLVSHEFFTHEFQVTNTVTGSTSTTETRKLRVISPNSVEEFSGDDLPSSERNIEAYFQGGQVFDTPGFERHGLQIELPPPLALIEYIQTGGLGDKVSSVDLLKAADDPTYVGTFIRLFIEVVPPAKQREAFGLLARHVPPKFTRVIVDTLEACAANELPNMAFGVFLLIVGTGLVLLARALPDGQALKGILGMFGLFMAGSSVFIVPIALVKRRTYTRLLHYASQVSC